MGRRRSNFVDSVVVQQQLEEVRRQREAREVREAEQRRQRAAQEQRDREWAEYRHRVEEERREKAQRQHAYARRITRWHTGNARRTRVN